MPIIVDGTGTIGAGIVMGPTSGGIMSGSIDMGTHKIESLGTPTVATDASTKGYVDSVLSLMAPSYCIFDPLMMPTACGAQAWPWAYRGNGASGHMDDIYSVAGLQNDYIEWTQCLRGGSWTFEVVTHTSTDCGIVTAYLDGVQIGSPADFYSASPQWEQRFSWSTTGVTSDVHTFRLKVTSKNGSSSGYYLHLCKVSGVRTGA